MYESPINLYMQEIMSKIADERENAIMAKISESMGVDIDKGELIKALQYDRQQYNKGYADAKAEYESTLDKIRAEILEEKECAYADFERYKVEYLGQDWKDAYDSLPQDDFRYGMERCIEIIDKYRKEQTDADSD